MTINQAKQIRLTDYLQALGYNPVRQSSNKLWYYSPLHTESNPSFKVNTDRNLWYDFGIGHGGSIIDFALVYYSITDISLALTMIERKSPIMEPRPVSSFRQQPSEPNFKDVEIKPLTHAALVNYIRERNIDIELCRQLCREAHYSIGDKRYFAIAFPNNSGGSELRNRYFKGCMPPKDITAIRSKQHYSECSIFEGFIDYISFLTMKKRGYAYGRLSEEQDFIILNSVTNLPKAIPLLEGYDSIYSFLDNDNAGRETHAKLVAAYGDKVVSMSEHFNDFNDVNDLLCWFEKKHE